jgi:hypothetical protein
MQSPITFCTHGEAVSGVPSVVTFRHVHDMISTATETLHISSRLFFLAAWCLAAAALARKRHTRRVPSFQNFRNLHLQKRRPSCC